MSTEDFKYSKVKNLNDVDFNIENFKRNEIENFSRQVFEELLRNKENVLSLFNNNVKEYFQRVKHEKEISELCQQQSSASHKLSELQKKLQSRKEEKENKDSNREIQRVLMYEQNLALRIDATSNTSNSEGEVALSFDFYNINENNPEETCSFVLMITDDNRYKAIKCHPPVTGMDELISTLNKTNDLHHFTVNIRKKFQESFLKSD